MTDPDTKRADIRDLGPAGVLAALWLICPALLGFLLLAKLSMASEWLESLGTSGPIVFAIVFAVTSGLGLLPTYAQAVVGGWVFGLSVGLTAALGGFVGGALIGWLTARLVSKHRVERAIERHPHASIIRRALLGGGFWRTSALVTLIRIPPNSPFALTNLVLAACGVRLGIHLLGTAVGMTPRTAIIVGLAAAGAASGAEDLQAFVTEGPGPWILVGGIVTLLIALSIIASIAKKAVAKFASDQQPPPA
ncbi:MAG: VTT domain-containing protein [Planctomycetes bacterium]|nr:VTT domain-containing protein [Planctomycetota bacterium]